MAEVDSRCCICGELRSAHVPTESGPETHPREARGEGTYELVRPAYLLAGPFPHDDDIEMPATYKFVPHNRHRDELSRVSDESVSTRLLPRFRAV